MRGDLSGSPLPSVFTQTHKLPMELLQTLLELGAIAFLTLTAFLLWE